MAIEKVCFTYVVKKITYRDNTLEKCCPYHLKETTKKKKYDAKDKYSSPDNIKFALSLPENNNPNDVIIDARDEVDQSFLFSTIKNVI